MSDATAPLARWAPILDALADFRGYLSDRVPAFELQHVNDKAWDPTRYRSMRRTGVYSRVGVYLHFDADERLLYVGVTLNRFDRLWGSRPREARYSDVIPVPPDMAFLALALERFLQDRLGIPPRRRGERRLPPADDSPSRGT